MGAFVLRCGKALDGVSDRLTGPVEILVEGERIGDRPLGASATRFSDDRSFGAHRMGLADT
jgi:hypothetical protein